MIFIIIFIIILVFIITGLIIGLTLFNNTTSNTSIIISEETQKQQNNFWLENYRGYQNVDIFPPGFNISPPAKHIFNILNNYKLVNYYKQLFDILSMICCQQIELQNSNCSNINIRYNQLLNMGANPNNNRATLIAAGYTSLQHNINANFIICAISIIENNMDNLINITKPDKEAIRGYLYIFYQTHLDPINKKIC
jgi:hypothetical protein